MNGIDGLLHLVGGPTLPGTFGDRHRSVIEQPFVAIGVNVQPAWGRDRQGIPSHTFLKF